MNRFQHASLLLAYLLGPPSYAANPISQVIVLHNGNAIMGKVEKDATRYIVSKGPWHVMRIPQYDVDFVARDLSEAVHIKRSRLRLHDFHGHVLLAQWCLRHGLDRFAGDLLIHLARLDPYHPAVRSLETQLQRRADIGVELVPKVQMVSHPKRRSPSPPPNSVNVADLPALPASVMADFTRVIQPLVLNRCGQSRCHGRATTSHFQLRKSGTKRQTMTWQNLRAVLAQVDAQNLTHSPLLVRATSTHGTATRPSFGPRDERLFQRLTEWVSQIGSNETALQLAKLDSTSNVSKNTVTDTGRNTAGKPLAKPAEPNPPADARPRSIDPFDPSVFNAQLEAPTKLDSAMP